MRGEKELKTFLSINYHKEMVEEIKKEFKNINLSLNRDECRKSFNRDEARNELNVKVEGEKNDERNRDSKRSNKQSE